MIHGFSSAGAYIALDVEDGSVFELDRLAWEALRLKEEGAVSGEIVRRLRGDFGEKAVMEALDELGDIFGEGGTPAIDDEALSLDTPGIIKAMCLHVAHDCNLRCAYCFADTGEYKGERGMMSREVGRAALDFLMENAGERTQLEVDFFGGEPLMNFPLVKELVAYGRELEGRTGKTIRFTLTTNALGLTPEIADFLNAELHNVVLSLDGRKAVHDRMRPTPNGSGSYDIALKNARNLVAGRGDKDYYVRGTYTHYNTDFSADILALADAGFEQLSVEPVIAQPSEHYALTQEDIPLVLEEYDVFLEKYLHRRKSGKWLNFFHFMVDLDQGPCLKKRLLGCGAGNEYVAVSPTGDIYPCHQFVGEAAYTMGDVLSGRFDRDMQAEFAANHVRNKPACRECWAKYYCSGGCAANAVHFNGDLRKPYATECVLQKKRLECALAAYARENGAGF